MNDTKQNTIYDVIFFWNENKSDREYKQYCGETLSNVLKYTPPISVKLVFEAFKTGKSLVFSSNNMNEAVDVRNILSALDMKCEIRPDSVKSNIKSH
jgi:hypothetical protein